MIFKTKQVQLLLKKIFRGQRIIITNGIITSKKGQKNPIQSPVVKVLRVSIGLTVYNNQTKPIPDDKFNILFIFGISLNRKPFRFVWRNIFIATKQQQKKTIFKHVKS